MVAEFTPFFGLPRDVARLLDAFAPSQTFSRQWNAYPPLNLSEDEHNIYVSAEAPGVALADLEITLADNTLVIKGERKAAEGRHYRQERSTGVFQRVVRLGAPVNREAITARLADGILEITLPKAEAAKPTKIAIKA